MEEPKIALVRIQSRDEYGNIIDSIRSIRGTPRETLVVYRNTNELHAHLNEIKSAMVNNALSLISAQVVEIENRIKAIRREILDESAIGPVNMAAILDETTDPNTGLETAFWRNKAVLDHLSGELRDMKDDIYRLGLYDEESPMTYPHYLKSVRGEDWGVGVISDFALDQIQNIDILHEMEDF